MNAPRDLPLGLVPGMPAEQYHADPAVSNGMLTAMNKSPAHCYWLHLHPARPKNEPTDAMRLGTLAHCAILEPTALGARYVAKPRGMRFSTKEGMAWRDAQLAEIVAAEDVEAAEAMRAAVLRVPALAKLLSAGEAETSVFWKDKATGLRCRARPDWLHWHGPKRVTAVDVKSINDLTPESVERAIASYAYHRQEAHYSNGLRAIGLEVVDFVFAFVSSSYPFLAVAHVLDDESREQGRDEVAELIDRFRNCRDLGVWPAFGDDYQLISLPKWAKRSSEVEVSYV